MAAERDVAVRTYPRGVPSWVDTEQPDVDDALRFYGGLFGWSFEDVMPPGAPGRYVIATLGGRDVCAVAGPGQDTAAWNTYIAVDDAGEGGRSAAFADPEGAEFRIWQARRRKGAQAVNEPATWNFSDLHTADSAAVRAPRTRGIRGCDRLDRGRGSG
jgi:hypothetical protein